MAYGKDCEKWPANRKIEYDIDEYEEPEEIDRFDECWLILFSLIVKY
jgi:hypothetical protein